MLLDFNRGTGSDDPISVRAAVDRGHAIVTRPVMRIMAAAAGLGVLIALITGEISIVLLGALGAPLVAWLWWSITVPQWRRWALKRGADPDELQHVAEAEMLVWPRGHPLERTEFGRRKRSPGK